MKKIQVLGDPNNQKFCSSDIIISNINNAAKKLGIYSDKEYCIVYDCIGNKHGYDPDALIIVYELIFPHFIFNNVYPKPILGVSRDNLSFIRDSGYPENLSEYFHLGIDTNVWQYKEKQKSEKFTLLGIGESNSRGGLELVVQNFCEEFKNESGIRLYLRDRTASHLFKKWVQHMALSYNAEILHDDRHLENFEEEKQIYYQSDAAICLNKSSTWNLRTIECMSTGTPLIVIPYGGPRDYSENNISAYHVEYDMRFITEENLDLLQNIGLRNHLFPVSIHPKTPVWTIPRTNSVRIAMRKVVEDANLRYNIGIKGSEYIKKFSWENSAKQLQIIINKLYDTFI